jgi:hypothetical protein
MATSKDLSEALDTDSALSSPGRAGSWRYLGSKKAEFEGDEVATTPDVATRLHYAPPWADVSIIGIAGSSGSGKSTLSGAIVRKLNLPWVVILSMVRTRQTRPGRSQSTLLIPTLRILSTRAWLPSSQQGHSIMSTTLTLLRCDRQEFAGARHVLILLLGHRF